MAETQLDGRLERWGRRIEALSGGSAYLLLAVSALLTLLQGGQSWGQRAATVGLAAATAGWMLWMVTLHPEWAGRRRLMGAYYLGLLGLIAALIARSPWFGIFAFTGYLHGWHLLAGGWRIAGVTATALLSATWQAGGLPEPTAAAIVSYLVFVALIVGLVVLFSSMGEVTAAQNRERKRVIGELAAANERLEATLVENAGLQAQVLAQAREAGVLDERQRMAGEIHDTLAQNLAGIIRQLEAAEQTADIHRIPGGAWRGYLERAAALARESLTEARRSVQALRPAPLEAAPLPEAIASLARRWETANEAAVAVTTTGEPLRLLAELETALFRVAQEALANVASHAGASRVGLTLSYMDDLVILDVRDDGAGFDPGAPAAAQAANGRGFGLKAMEQRLRRVAGTLEIESAPGAGTAISAAVPALAAAE